MRIKRQIEATIPFPRFNALALKSFPSWANNMAAIAHINADNNALEAPNI